MNTKSMALNIPRTSIQDIIHNEEYHALQILRVPALLPTHHIFLNLGVEYTHRWFRIYDRLQIAPPLFMPGCLASRCCLVLCVLDYCGIPWWVWTPLSCFVRPTGLFYCHSIRTPLDRLQASWAMGQWFSCPSPANAISLQPMLFSWLHPCTRCDYCKATGLPFFSACNNHPKLFVKEFCPRASLRPLSSLGPLFFTSLMHSLSASRLWHLAHLCYFVMVYAKGHPEQELALTRLLLLTAVPQLL